MEMSDFSSTWSKSTSYPAVYKVIQTTSTITSLENTFMINHYKTYQIYYSEMDILHNEYFYCLYFHYILMIILLCFYLRNILNAGLFTVTEYSYTLVLLLLLKYKIWVLLLLLKYKIWVLLLSLVLDKFSGISKTRIYVNPSLLLLWNKMHQKTFLSGLWII